MSDAQQKENGEKSRKPSESNAQSNTIWGSAFVRLSLYILLGFILLATARYVYLKVTGNYPAQYEEQSIIQYPHLEQLQSNQNKAASGSEPENSTDAAKDKSTNSSKTDSLPQNGGRRK